MLAKVLKSVNFGRDAAEKTYKWAVPVSGPHVAGFGNAHPAGPNEGGPRGRGGPAWAPPAVV